MTEETKNDTPVVTDFNELETKRDFFHADVEPGFKGHWARKDPRRIEEMKKMGYEMDPSSSRAETIKKRQEGIDLLDKKLNNPKTTPADRAVLKDLIEQQRVSPLATETSLPENVLMRMGNEAYAKRVAMKKGRSDQMKEQLAENLENFDRAAKKAGIGGLKALTKILEERQGRR